MSSKPLHNCGLRAAAAIYPEYIKAVRLVDELAMKLPHPNGELGYSKSILISTLGALRAG
eukprot:2085333-Amphidinium_carterae.1